jgi:hypothetical protein
MTSRDHPSHGHCDMAHVQVAVEAVAVRLLSPPCDQHEHQAVAEVEEAAVAQQLLLQHSSMGLEPPLVLGDLGTMDGRRGPWSSNGGAHEHSIWRSLSGDRSWELQLEP